MNQVATVYKGTTSKMRRVAVRCAIRNAVSAILTLPLVRAVEADLEIQTHLIAVATMDILRMARVLIVKCAIFSAQNVSIKRIIVFSVKKRNTSIHNLVVVFFFTFPHSLSVI